MTKKLLSIAYMALILCVVSKLSASDVTILNVPIEKFMSQLISRTDQSTTIRNSIYDEITMLEISKKGMFYQLKSLSKIPDPEKLVKRTWAENPPHQVADSFTTSSASARLEGSIVGKNNISISAESFSFQDLTVFGTNGNVTLNFNNPKSLIKSITFGTSDIATTSKGEELHIGSVWGDFTGVPSSDAQRIHFIGYPKISIQFNLAAIAELNS